MDKFGKKLKKLKNIENMEQIKLSTANFDWISLSRITPITFIDAHPEYPWVWGRYGVSANHTVSIEYIKTHPDPSRRDGIGSAEPWYWGESGVSANPNLTMEFVRDRPEYSWYYECSGYGISNNHGPIIMDVLEASPHPGLWSFESANPGITLEFIEKHSDKPWNWGKGGLSSNRVVTPEFVLKNRDKPWYFGEGGLKLEALPV